MPNPDLPNNPLAHLNDPRMAMRIRTNTIFKAIGESTRVFSMLLFVLMARVLGGAEFGAFSVAFALATFFVTWTDGGLNQLMIRDIAVSAESAQERVELTLGIKLCLMPAVILALAAWMAAFHYPASSLRLGLLCGGIAITKSLLDYFSAICSGHERMNTESVLKGFSQLAALAGGSWVLLRGRGVEALAMTLIATNALSALVALVVIRRMNMAPRKILIQWSRWVSLWKESLPLAVSVMINALFLRVDLIMLSLFRKPVFQIGLFAATAKIFEASGALPALLCTALFPIMADNAKNRPVLFVELFRKWRLYLLGLALAIGGLLIVTRHWLIYYLFGSSYAPAATTLTVLMTAMPSMFLNYWLINNLIVLREQRYVAIATASSLATNILANAALIPAYGGTGVAFSILLSQTVMAAVATYRLRVFQQRIELDRISEIKSGLAHYYSTAKVYYHQLDDYLDEQLEHLVFGGAKLLDWVAKAKSVLEVGCGSGILLHHLKKTFPEKRFSGVDLSPIGIEMAQERARSENLNIDYRITDIEGGSPFPAGSFDLVICHEVLEHLTNPLAAITHMSQMLAPEGYLVLVFPNRCIRASFTNKIEKVWDTVRMMLDRDCIPLRFETPVFDRVGGDADATYIAHPWEVQRMVRRSGLQIRYHSLLRGRLVAQR